MSLKPKLSAMEVVGVGVTSNLTNPDTSSRILAVRIA